MIRFALIFFSSVMLCAAAPPQPAITSAEEALERFRLARDGEIKAALSGLPDSVSHYQLVVRYSHAPHLVIRQFVPRDYQPPYRETAPRDGSGFHIFGSFEAASKCPNVTWQLDYDSSWGGLLVYLDAATGRVLCVSSVPEG